MASTSFGRSAVALMVSGLMQMTVSAGEAQAQNIDHYQCYKVKQIKGVCQDNFSAACKTDADCPSGICLKKFVSTNVSLTDQFGSASPEVKKPKSLCAPVEKNPQGPPPQDPALHYERYQIKGGPSVKGLRVLARDQFGDHVIELTKADSLYVPAAKDLNNPVEPPASGPNHYLCYKAKNKKKICTDDLFTRCKTDADCTEGGICDLGFGKVAQELTDQFGNPTVEINKAKLFCTPVDKNGEGIADPSNHLVGYQIKGPGINATVHTNNQFGPESVALSKNEFLLVPALKNPGAEPICGDGVVNQPSEVCDGADATICPGECQPDCTCAVPPTCGDGKVNNTSEQCDGPDDAACPDECLTDCTCAPPPWCEDGALDPCPEVRIGYLIPSNRTAQVNAIPHLQALIPILTSWLCEQMDRNGFGRKSFRFETEPDGLTPVVSVVNVPETDEFLGEDLWGRGNDAAIAAGLTVWTRGAVWLLIPETHLQLADAAIVGATALGGSFGSADDPGVAMVGSDMLWPELPAGLTNDTLYDGLIVPALGPLPLVFGVSYPFFNGDTFSANASVWAGGTMHEMLHAFGLPHDFRNDVNFHGNILGNGFRGIRGALFPDSYPNDETRLSYSAALPLNVSRYFTPSVCARDFTSLLGLSQGASTLANGFALKKAGRLAAATDPTRWEVYGEGEPVMPFPTVEPSQRRMRALGGLADNNLPTITVSTFGMVNPVDGQVEIDFSATDDVDLAVALLSYNGNAVGEMALSGTSVITSFRTAYYEPGVGGDYRVSVYDTSGNQTNQTQTITAATGFNRAPQPYFQVSPSQANVNEQVTLDATGSLDPDHSLSELTVEWDIDGDGTFDTAPTTNKVLITSFSQPGTLLVRVRVSDPLGAQSISTAIAIRVSP